MSETIYYNTRNGKRLIVRESNVRKWFYYPDYAGPFAWGATMPYSETFLQDAVARGILVLA